MIIADIDQLSDEWLRAKAGLISASSMDKVVTSKGVLSQSHKAYMYQLAGESFIGRRAESYQNATMLRGIVLEPVARANYAWDNDVEVREVGICYKDEKKRIGCSPDGLISEDGGLEIKCPEIHTHIQYLLEKKLPTTYFQQVQSSLFITDREWWDFMSYYPGLPDFIIRVYPDKAFHANLDVILKTFVFELDEMIEKLKN